MQQQQQPAVPQPALSSRRDGVAGAVPIAFWPSTYVPQEIICLAVSPDGSTLAAACSSGQVYIWSCSVVATPGRDALVKLDPVAVALSGWLGPNEVFGLDFCICDEAAQAVGALPRLLLACLLSSGQIRILDTTDGRCVMSVPGRRPLGDDSHMGGGSVLFRVLEDGHHVLLATGSGDPVLLDLLSGQDVISFPVPAVSNDGPLLNLVAPPYSTGCGGDNGLHFAAFTCKTLMLWHWLKPAAGTRSPPTRPSCSLSFGFGGRTTRSGGTSSTAPVAVVFKAGYLVLVLAEEVLVWRVKSDNSGVSSYLEWKIPQQASFSALTGAAILGGMAPHTGPQLKMASSGVGKSLQSQRRPRSASPPRPDLPVDQPPRLILWTSQCSVYNTALDTASSSALSYDVLCSPWTSLPASEQHVAWWCLGSSLVGATFDSLGDKIFLQAAEAQIPRPQWTCAADLEDLWRMPPQKAGRRMQHGQSTMTAAVLVQARQCTWLVLGMLKAGGHDGCVCALSLAGEAQTRRLALPEGFAKPTSLLALGPRFLACGDARGAVCWWALPDLTLGGSVAARDCTAAVLSLVRVWSLGPHQDELLPDPSIVAALDELGKCRILDLTTGEVLCSLQSQSGVSLWIDKPLRMIHDPAGRYICAATPGRTWVWDLGSGSFERSVGEAKPEEEPARGMPPPRKEAVPGSQRWSIYRSPGFGLSAVVWQAPAAAEPSAPNARAAWWLGEACLDGPLWKLPVVLVAPSDLLVAPPAAVEAAGPGAPGKEVTMEGPAWPPIEIPREIEEQLSELGVCLPGVPFLVGSMGADNALSFPLPRRRGLAVHSQPPARLRKPPCAVGESRSSDLLAVVAGCRRKVQNTPDAAGGPHALALPSYPSSQDIHVGLANIAWLLLHAESPRPLLQQCALPLLRQLLRGPASVDAISSLAAWVAVLHMKPPREPPPESSLRQGPFGTVAAFRDGATVLLALLGHLQPRLFEQRCPAAVAGLVAEGLCARMFSRSSSVQLQSLCCEVFAMAFSFWRRHISPQAMSNMPCSLGRSTGAPRPAGAGARGGGGGASTPGAPGAGPAALRGAGGGPAGEQQAPAVVLMEEAAGDECLEWLALHLLALYQEPRVAPSSLEVLMHVGMADAGTLLHIMGKAARRLEAGAAYTSSALFVLVNFIQRYPSKVLPFLSKFTEAVLRCLEPSDPSLRRQSLLAVTGALHELVQTFPMVAFHQQSQKFAVGTGDGLVVVYDLRTATKWRILEGHAAGPVSALAFSHDGGQLCSYSSFDRTVRMWQCNPTGFFGGLLGTSGRCLKSQSLPVIPAGAAANAGDEGAWRTVSLAWPAPTPAGSSPLSLVRENGEAVQVSFDST